MTELLRQAISQIEKLPADRQDAIATQLLEELKSAREWETRFAATTDDRWDRMAAMVIHEIASDETVSLEYEN